MTLEGRSGVLLAFLWLAAVAGASLKSDEYQPSGGLFADQRWTYGDVILVFVLLEFVGALSAIASHIRGVPDLWLWALRYSIKALFLLGAVYGLLRWKHGLPFSILGFRKRHAGHYAVWSFQVVFAIFGVLGLFISLVLLTNVPLSRLLSLPGRPALASVLHQLGEQEPVTILFSVIWILDGMLLFPLLEEVLFRGFLYTPLCRKFGPRGAAAFSSVLWSLHHYPAWGRMITALVLGFAYIHLYQRTQSLVPSLTLHAASNSIGLVAGLLIRLQLWQAFILPATVASLILLVACAAIVKRTGPTVPQYRLAWSGGR